MQAFRGEIRDVRCDEADGDFHRGIDNMAERA